METAHRYTDLEKQELIEQWKQSGLSKILFCKNKNVNYYTFVDWTGKRDRKQKTRSLFIPVKVNSNNNSPFAQIVLKNGTSITIHQQVDPSYLSALLK